MHTTPLKRVSNSGLLYELLNTLNKFIYTLSYSDEDALLQTKCPKHVELRWQTEVSSSIYATPLIADINRYLPLNLVSVFSITPILVICVREISLYLLLFLNTLIIFFCLLFVLLMWGYCVVHETMSSSQQAFCNY